MVGLTRCLLDIGVDRRLALLLDPEAIDDRRGHDVENDSTTDWPSGLAAPARRALDGAGYTRLDQLAEVREDDLAALHGMGPKALRQLRDALAARGLGFAP